VTHNAPQWTIITVTYNSAPALSEHPLSIRSDSVEWIVVDNASSDDSAAIAESLGARVIRLENNVGFARANNIGVLSSDGSHLLFLNPDVVPDLADLEQLEQVLAKDGGIVAPQLLNSDLTLQPNGRGAPYLIRKIRNRILTSREMNRSYWLFAEPQEIRRVNWVMGAAIAMLREDFEKIRGWNEEYFIYYEDTDICLRTAKMNMPVRVDGHCRWVHLWARETSGLSLRAWWYEIRSAALFYSSHPQFLIPLL
jgi:GT2 family glycosyltransferase